MKVWKGFLIMFLLGATASISLAEQNLPEQKIFRSGSRPSVMIKSDNFTGKVRLDPAFQSVAPARSYGAWVTFEPESRTDWHIHPLGQTLIVTSGRGITQEWGKAPNIILPGDVVVCPPGVKHWHGAAPDTAMTHIAIGEMDGKGTEWLEKVSESEYEKAANEAAGSVREGKL